MNIKIIPTTTTIDYYDEIERKIIENTDNINFWGNIEQTAQVNQLFDNVLDILFSGCIAAGENPLEILPDRKQYNSEDIATIKQIAANFINNRFSAEHLNMICQMLTIITNETWVRKTIHTGSNWQYIFYPEKQHTDENIRQITQNYFI